MGEQRSAKAGTTAKSGPVGRFGVLRRRLFLLTGLGAAAVAKAVIDAPAPAHAAGFVVGAPPGYAPVDAQADGVQGYAIGADNAGTFGRNNDLNGVGVHGVAPSGVGTFGSSASGTGVGAQSSTGSAVVARSTSSAGVDARSTSGVAVSGVSTTHAGVVGSGASFGVLGGNTGPNCGVYGTSVSGAGVMGSASGSGVPGVYGENLTGGYGVRAASPNGTGLYAAGGTRAAVFVGSVEVQGNFTVLGGYAKSAAVQHPDGTFRRFYSVESPDSWFEDAGDAQLVDGRASVGLDSDFAPFVQTESYQIFLTPKGDCNGLYVARQDAKGFEVQESRGGRSSLAFSYRVMAKRRDLAAPGRRLERVDEAAPAPAVPDKWRQLPAALETTELPAAPR